MQDLVTKMYFRNDKTGGLVRKPFQYGILASINSTISLFHELKDEGVKYFLTKRVNQDCLESFFSCVRGIGGSNSHPSPSEVIRRIRKLCVSKNIDHVIDLCNVENTDKGMKDPLQDASHHLKFTA